MIKRRHFLRLSSLAGILGLGRHSLLALAPAPLLLDPPADPEWDWWRELPRTPIVQSDDPATDCLCRAARLRRDVTIVYDGGSEPGCGRRISPLGVFRVEGYCGTYLHARCHARAAERTFRVERIAAVM